MQKEQVWKNNRSAMNDIHGVTKFNNGLKFRGHYPLNFELLLSFVT